MLPLSPHTSSSKQFPCNTMPFPAHPHTKLLVSSILLGYLSVNVKAGLVIDPQPEVPDAHFGDSCSVSAYKAFREPIIILTGLYYEDYNQMSVEINKFSNFSLNGVPYDYVPKKYRGIICKSKVTPLMCAAEGGPGGDQGRCTCLQLNSTAVKINTASVFSTYYFNQTLGVDRTLPRFSKDDKTYANDEDKATKIPSTPSQLKPTKPTFVQLTVTQVRCYAKKGDFCITPFIPCLPTMDKRGRWTSNCVYGKCTARGGGSLRHSLWTYHAFLVISLVLKGIQP